MKREELFALPFWPEIETKLKAGDAIQPISKEIQGKGHFPEVKIGTLNMQLARIRDQLQGVKRERKKPRKRVFIAHRALSKYPKLKHFFKVTLEKVETLEELKALYRYQVARITEYANIEEQTQVPIPAVLNEIKQARDTLMSIRDIQVEMGLEKRKPEEFWIGFESVVKDVDPQKRERVRGVLRLIKGTGALQLPQKAETVNKDDE